MSVLLILNELSCATPTSRKRVDQAMIELVDLLKAVRRWRSDIALVTHVRRESIELAPGYYVQQWIGADPANRDRWRFLIAIQNRAPFRSVIPEDVNGHVEYRHEGRPAEGLGTAHLLDGLAISLRLDAVWDHAWIATDRSILVETDSGDVAMRDEQVKVRHAATRDHATSHKDWIQEVGRDDLNSGAAIWNNKDRFFPHLSFLPRVEEDLRNLRPYWVRPAVQLLFKLEKAIADWNPGEAVTPRWQTKITGEYETRQRQFCQFTDLDGVVRVFELHARLTPGAGRLHFRLVPEEGTARVAYIGPKLGT